MFTDKFFKFANVLLLTTFLSACGGGSGGGSNKGPAASTSSTSTSSTSSTPISSSSSSAPVANTLAEIDPVKQTKPSIKFLQYSEAIALFANETLYLIRRMENGENDVNPDVLHECSYKQGTYKITTATPINGAQDFKITFDNCFYATYDAVLTGELSVEVKTWMRTIGVDGSVEVNINQLSYVYRQAPLATISGNFVTDYATGEDFGDKKINAISDIVFKINNTTDIIKSLNLTYLANYAEGNYTVNLNLHAYDSQINSEFDLLTEQPLKGNTGRAPLEGNIQQTGYSNNIRYIPVRDKDNLTYQLSFDLGNQNNYQTLPAIYNWKDFSNLAFMWDYTSQRTYINGTDVGLRVNPSDATMEFRGFFTFGIPGALGYYNELRKDKPLTIYTYNSVNISQAKQISVQNGAYIFNLVVADSHKLLVVPPSDLPAGWYHLNFSVTDELGGVIESTHDLHYLEQ